MAYVRNHGNQLAIVHGERDPKTRNVRQRVLFTICSKPEAEAALRQERATLTRMLEDRYPRIHFDWSSIHAGIEKRLDALPKTYSYRPGEALGHFRADLCALTRQLGLADPQSMLSAAQVIQEHRVELEYVRDLIDWRLSTCEQEGNDWNGDNAFFWRRRLQREDAPPEVLEQLADLLARGELDRVEALARLFIDSYECFADGHNHLGLVAQERGEFLQAVQHFRRAMEEGRKLFPKRLPREDYWLDIDTRPYMRGQRNLAVALMKLRRFDEALEICERMERVCGDSSAAGTFRAHIHLNIGLYDEALRAAESMVEFWPEHAYIAAFASLEQGDRDGALRWFLHGALTRPRTGRLLLGMNSRSPKGYEQLSDHNTGIDELGFLAPYLERLDLSSRALFKAILAAPTTRALLSEANDVIERRRTQHLTEDREAFDRMMELHSRTFAWQAADAVRKEVQSSRGWLARSS